MSFCSVENRGGFSVSAESSCSSQKTLPLFLSLQQKDHRKNTLLSERGPSGSLLMLPMSRRAESGALRRFVQASQDVTSCPHRK